MALRGGPGPTALHVLSIQFVFCCRCSGRSLPQPHELPPSAVLGDTESCSAWGTGLAFPLGFPSPLTWSDRALATPLTGSAVSVPSQALQLLLSDLVEVPWGRPLALESWPQSLSQGQLQPGHSEQGWVSGSIPSGQLDTHSDQAPWWQCPGVTIPACPGAGMGSAVARAVPSGAPRAAPQLPGPAGLGLHPSPHTATPWEL